ncbi:SRPBCC family protein [Aquimarina sediminis]|uniref:hypothetical protein n=1 Tax=Aquimarina sediminis TaxID=2070536 RepID=UPI000CA063A8|nr:hypothetical protein [Aquimarina sediminis]
MVILTKNEIEINSNINDVFEFTSDMGNFGLWFPDVISIRSKDKLPSATIGKEYLETAKKPFGGTVKILIQVKEVIKNKIYVTEGNFFPLFPRMTLNFKKRSEDKTYLYFKMESRSKSFFFKMFLLPIVKLILKKRAKAGLINLKKILESK